MSESISRREFLASTTLAAAAVLADPRRAMARVEPPKTQPYSDWKMKPVLDFSKSPHAKLRQVPVGAVTVTGYWAARRKTNVASSIPSMREELVQHGRMTNFERLQGTSTEPQKGPVYSDSDMYKWTEAVAYVLQSQDAPELKKMTDAQIREIVAVQEPSGYLNTYYVEDRKALRMQQHTQEVGHELYCMGHYLQGAIAYYRATGDATMLNAGIRFVDDFLLPNYGPGANQTPIISGHPEIEMSLIELYRTTGNRKYVDLAGYILHGDKRWTIKPSAIVYMYCGIPFPERTKLEGHAVRCMYACCGATDYYLETGDPAYWKTLEALWQDLVSHQLYVTGGVGARAEGEAFGDAYELPNARAYGESCAAIGNMMWNARMLAATGEARFTDVMERALYNGINSGMSLDGRLYCYRNPLAFEPATGDVIRNPWYDTTCCPPNIERTFSSLPGYFYSTSKDGIYVHLYDASEMNWHLEDGTGLKIVQKTQYPWKGDVELTVSPAKSHEFTVFLRIPGWSAKNTVRVNGQVVDGAKAGEYLAIRRTWNAGDKIQLAMDMTPHVLQANPAVMEDVGKVAMQRGPVVFCMEGMDQAAQDHGLNLSKLRADLKGETKVRFEPEMLGGVTVLEHPGSVVAQGSPDLYRTAAGDGSEKKGTMLTLIPYYAWANRKPSPMQVWIPYTEA
ncbi:MAG TPA: beta-L-arabinofuranosidase domain-containing protein [Edaphobacter sp.]|nr:beta-L-arabinofuranosidase domain-containing protein [Edaphobacter sp.]